MRAAFRDMFHWELIAAASRQKKNGNKGLSLT
jgi:hypothetical protein